jgi:hypothetical protein
MAAGSAISIYNDSIATINLVQDTGMTLRLAATATTGTRTLLSRGLATIWFNTTTEAIATGAGVA